MYIETDKLIIRPPIIEDVEGAFEFKKDKIATKYVGGTTVLNFQDFKYKFIDFCKSYVSNSPFEYSVILKETNKYIGYCGINYCNIIDDFELIYGFISQYWNRGYGKESAKEILKYGFEELDLNNIKASVNPLNISSEKILKGLGFEFKKKIEWPNQGLINMYEIKR